MAYTKDPNELGALWMKTGAKGDYMTGSIEIDGVAVGIVCFAVDKRSEKSPSWRVLRAKPREDAPMRSNVASFPQDTPLSDDDIPF